MDLTGMKFNKLYVIEKTQEKSKSGDYKYKCICECGNERLVIGTNLKNGHTKSCGCINNDRNCSISKGYRKKNIRLYNIYCGMKQRCYYKKTKEYKNYGARGIKVCDEWLNNYISFYNWAMNNGYRDDLSIDRIDNNGNYEPNNCRWATRIEQANNMSNNKKITYRGETKTLAEWGRTLNIQPQKLSYRLKHWDIDKAFNK